MAKKLSKNQVRLRKHRRIRKHLAGTGECPRLCVFRSLSNIYAQIIDDNAGKTLVSASSLEADFKAEKISGGNLAGAKQVGKMIAKKALEQGIEQVVFDRGGYLYHGRVAALADGAREAGLKF